MAVIFLFLKLEEYFFPENVYLYVNFILEITKYKFQRPQLYLAAASRRSWRSAGKWRRIFLKFYVDMLEKLKFKI